MMAANAGQQQQQQQQQQPRLRKRLAVVFCCVLLSASLGYLRVFSSSNISQLGSHDESHRRQNRRAKSQRVHAREMKKEHHEHTGSHEWVGNEATTKPITTTTTTTTTTTVVDVASSASEPSTSCTVEDHLLGASTEKRKQLFGDKTKKYCGDDDGSVATCLHRRVGYPESMCIAKNVRVDGEKFRRWISTPVENANHNTGYYPKQTVPRGVLTAPCENGEINLPREMFGKGGQEVFVEGFAVGRNDCEGGRNVSEPVYVLAHSYGMFNPWHELEQVVHIYGTMLALDLPTDPRINGRLIIFDAPGHDNIPQTFLPVYHPLVERFFGNRPFQSMRDFLQNDECVKFSKLAFLPHGGTSPLSRSISSRQTCSPSPLMSAFVKDFLDSVPEVRDVTSTKIVIVERGSESHRKHTHLGYGDFLEELKRSNEYNKDVVSVVNFGKEGLGILEQMKIARSAKVLIGEHGAALTHALWMRPGTKLVEITDTFRCHCYDNIAEWRQLDYVKESRKGVSLRMWLWKEIKSFTNTPDG